MAQLARPLLFAHRGGRAHAPDNSLAAFRGALARGCPGLESDVRVTSDGIAVLCHDPTVRVRRSLRRARVAELPAQALPAGVVSLADLFAACGTGFALSLDVKDARALRPTLAAARAAGMPGGSLWLCGGRAEVARWRPVVGDVRLVESTRLRSLGDGEARDRIDRVADAARAARRAGADALNLPFSDWSRLGAPGVAAVQAAGLAVFGWDASSELTVRALSVLGVDAIYGDDVTALLAGSAAPADAGPR